jgi:cytidylate kinase
MPWNWWYIKSKDILPSKWYDGFTCVFVLRDQAEEQKYYAIYGIDIMLFIPLITTTVVAQVIMSNRHVESFIFWDL